MPSPTATFRLDPKTIKAMDRLITDPPAVCFDGIRGAARNRTELITVLVQKALEEQEKMKEARSKKG